MIKNFMKNKTKDQEIVFKGQATAPGIAVGRAYLFKPFAIDPAELNTTQEKTSDEIILFEEACGKVLEQLDFAFKQSQDSFGDRFSAIFESQISFLHDQDLLKEVKAEILNNKYSAINAITKILSQKSDHFIQLENIYFRERAFDIIDLKQKLVLALLGMKIDYHLSAPSIIVAENISPSDTVNFNRNLILGFLTEQGGQTSHSSILARGLRIPSVVHGKNFTTLITDGDDLIVDGFEGKIILNPEPETKEKYLRLKDKYKQQEAVLIASNTKEAITLDNVKVNLLANIEFSHEVNDVNNFRADGVGLFRTESLFLEQDSIPSEEQQFLVYKKIAQSLKNKPFIIRTIDLGGDKLLPGFSNDSEPNPFLGWRAIRLCLDNPQIFKPQIRAILRASEYGKISILLPMINSVNEILQVKELLAEARLELQITDTISNKNVQLGVMVETPSAAINAPMLAKYVDFLSIGSNDLTQYALAVDRTNEKISHLYNSFDPSVIRLMHTTINAGIANNIPVSICGEFASVPEAVPVLLGMGLRSLSVTPHLIPMIKKIIRSVHIRSCIKLLDHIQTLHHPVEIEEECNKFIKLNVPELSFSKEDNR